MMMHLSSRTYRALDRVVLRDSAYGYVYLRLFQHRLLADHQRSSGSSISS